ncbi:protein SGT1 homolog isoform X2 [Bradysia coprophila]|uniref:protein SGT1 homolog isoform X2 n=1 Tax=Bradysia coprophila TaxID=38358 RepID=UPI00187DD5E9|nr:protein SGT1 homolog isoform X2 [Bradysia coprophila]
MSTAVRHDWYQTDEKVVITVMIKKPIELNCEVTMEPDRLLIEADGDIRLEFHLCQSINAEKSTYKFGSAKVEVTLIKLISERWADLTKEKAEAKPKVVNIYKHNWDSLAKLLEKEHEDDRGLVNEGFKKIYQNASPDVRRAMNKSFLESNGTVLNTGWEEVGAKKTEMRPPDGTEFVSWKDAQ